MYVCVCRFRGDAKRGRKVQKPFPITLSLSLYLSLCNAVSLPLVCRNFWDGTARRRNCAGRFAVQIIYRSRRRIGNNRTNEARRRTGSTVTRSRSSGRLRRRSARTRSRRGRAASRAARRTIRTSRCSIRITNSHNSLRGKFQSSKAIYTRRIWMWSDEEKKRLIFLFNKKKQAIFLFNIGKTSDKSKKVVRLCKWDANDQLSRLSSNFYRFIFILKYPLIFVSGIYKGQSCVKLAVTAPRGPQTLNCQLLLTSYPLLRSEFWPNFSVRNFLLKLWKLLGFFPSEAPRLEKGESLVRGVWYYLLCLT